MRTATLFMLVVVVITFLVDAYFLFSGGFTKTISYALWVNFREFPVLSFLLGMVVGHLVWPLNDYKAPSDDKPEEIDEI